MIDFRAVTAIVVESLHQSSFFAVDQHRNPGRHFILFLRLKVVRPIVCQKDIVINKIENTLHQTTSRKTTKTSDCIEKKKEFPFDEN